MNINRDGEQMSSIKRVHSNSSDSDDGEAFRLNYFANQLIQFGLRNKSFC